MKNIFDLHNSILDSYKSYIDSFINIADKKIESKVKQEFNLGKLYPEPLIHFNPSFESGGKVKDLVDKGILVSEFNDIFYDQAGESWTIYKHQIEAITKGFEGKGFVVTSGTGSGKSLIYISTIFNYLFKNRNKRGIKAIIVYPLNALINSQEAALKGFEENYKKRTGSNFPFTYAKYTGQEQQEARENVIANPPDILLTNYMMLELLMVRKADESLRKSFLDNIEFLVFDELHTYKGRQGADVSLLIRRIKAASKNKEILCIGTSATMASGSIEEQKTAVAKVATSFFDTTISSDEVIVESLTYSTKDIKPSKEELKVALNSVFSDSSKKAILENPIAIWLERTIAIISEGEKKKRNKPKDLKAIAQELSNETDENLLKCENQIKSILIWAEELNIQSVREKKKDTILPFKLHQFISQTGYVYVTLEHPDRRFITLEPNPFIKDKDNKAEVPVFQTVFSRVSGVEFICVRKDFEQSKFVFRDFNDEHNPRNEDDLKVNNKKTTKRNQDHYKDGYLFFDKENLVSINDFTDILPSSWLKNNIITEAKSFLLPKEIYVSKDGSFSNDNNGGEKFWFMPTPLKFDPTCGLIYLETQLSEKSKLISLGNEGRSTSTTLITLQTLLSLYKHGKPIKEQKLMSFTDNRQDASLQAGHFNDFIQVIHLRSAIEKVLRTAVEPLKISDLIFKVQDALSLPEIEYANNPAPNPNRPNEDNIEALRNYITYRIIQDLKRGWRYVLPNLEQTALLGITYKNFDADIADESLWKNIEFFNILTLEKRKEFILQILNYFRNMYAVDYEMLRYEKRLQVTKELDDHLNKEKLWSLDKGEKIEPPVFLSVLGQDKGPRETFIESIGASGRLARYIKHEFRIANVPQLNAKDYNTFLTTILDALAEAHYLKKIKINAEKGEKDCYQLILSKVLWQKGNKVDVIIDKTQYITLDNEIKIKPHKYFQDLYQEDFSKLPKSYLAAEHTGQIKNEDKIEREGKFNEAEISALYCSPTMELGIDISDLNIVHMRNVPPNPANYAQRSGRAGRNGQSALVFTYASKVAPHDIHYFANPVKMVAGVVQAPRIDLTNEELIRSHTNATVLSFLNAEEFKPSLVDLIDIVGKTYKLKAEIKAKYQDIIDNRFIEIKQLVKKVIAKIEFKDSKWYNDIWLEKEIKTVPDKLEHALLRWRKMYLDAIRQMSDAYEKEISPIIKDSDEKKRASLSYIRAKDRKNLLENHTDKNRNTTLSEFYTFRYLASEGFLPGYNFTRLPIRVFLGGKDKNESISRPRFIGLKEFAPLNLIYHNGGKFKVNRITPNDVSLVLTEIKISKETNYAFLGKDDGKGKNQDPITGSPFTASNMEMYFNLLELEEAQSENTDRISCMEEVRSTEGYETDIFINSTDSLIDATKIKLTVDGDELMKLFYASAAKLILLNKKWKKSQEAGFNIGTKTGFFKTKKQLEKPNLEDPPANIMLFTYDTSDILYIQPIQSLGLTDVGVTTLLYALEKAIEQLYNIEPVEIAARLMGSEKNKNIMLYESAEGSIGVLKDIARNPAMLKKIFLKAYEICGYDFDKKTDQFPERPKASYDDFLSYYNQTDHTKIDRHSIIAALELLSNSNPDDTIGGSYEEKYETLKKGLHHRSLGEKELLDYLFNNGYRLPDYTNHNMAQFYVQPDFVYDKEKALIFVDGGIHKRAFNKADDEKKRNAIELAGFDVLVWDYTTEQVEAFIAKRQDIFRKVR